MSSAHQHDAAGDGNCFYRALVVALLEDLALHHEQQRYVTSLHALRTQMRLARGWSAIDDDYWQYVKNGYDFLEVARLTCTVKNETRVLSQAVLMQHKQQSNLCLTVLS